MLVSCITTSASSRLANSDVKNEWIAGSYLTNKAMNSSCFGDGEDALTSDDPAIRGLLLYARLSLLASITSPQFQTGPKFQQKVYRMAAPIAVSPFKGWTYDARRRPLRRVLPSGRVAICFGSVVERLFVAQRISFPLLIKKHRDSQPGLHRRELQPRMFCRHSAA